MQKDLKGKKGNSLKSAIIIDAQDAITGVTMEHGYIDQLINSLGGGVKSIEQNLVLEDEKKLDRIVLTFDDGTEFILFFDVTSFFGKMKKHL